MRNIQDFLAFALSHASPARIPSGSTLCVPLERVGSAGVWEYLFGTTGQKCTQALLDKKYSQYYKGWGWTKAEYAAATQGWVERGVTVCDCQGLEDYFSQADTNAKGNYAKYCTDKGQISKLNRPYVLGEAVFVGKTPGGINHVGWVCGFAPDGEPLVVHERGLAHGCVVERMGQAGKKWSYRGLMTKRYEYGPAGQEEGPTGPGQEVKPVDKQVLRMTSPLMRGEGIQSLQAGLNALGYPCGTADGICGTKTLGAVADFCAAHGSGALPESLAVTVAAGGKAYQGQLNRI